MLQRSERRASQPAGAHPARTATSSRAPGDWPTQAERSRRQILTGTLSRPRRPIRSNGATAARRCRMKSIPQQALAELIGTLALVFIGAGSVAVLGFNGPSVEAIVGIALAHGLVLAIMVSNFGHI